MSDLSLNKPGYRDSTSDGIVTGDAGKVGNPYHDPKSGEFSSGPGGGGGAKHPFSGETYTPGESSETVAVAHGFTNNISGGAGSNEYENPKYPGHVISVEHSGSWTHVKGFNANSLGEVIASGKGPRSLATHLNNYKG